jgi:hypothetical protein
MGRVDRYRGLQLGAALATAFGEVPVFEPPAAGVQQNQADRRRSRWHAPTQRTLRLIGVVGDHDCTTSPDPLDDIGQDGQVGDHQIGPRPDPIGAPPPVQKPPRSGRRAVDGEGDPLRAGHAARPAIDPPHGYAEASSPHRAGTRPVTSRSPRRVRACNHEAISLRRHYPDQVVGVAGLAHLRELAQPLSLSAPSHASQSHRHAATLPSWPVGSKGPFRPNSGDRDVSTWCHPPRGSGTARAGTAASCTMRAAWLPSTIRGTPRR